MKTVNMAENGSKWHFGGFGGLKMVILAIFWLEPRFAAAGAAERRAPAGRGGRRSEILDRIHRIYRMGLGVRPKILIILLILSKTAGAGSGNAISNNQHSISNVQGNSRGTGASRLQTA